MDWSCILCFGSKGRQPTTAVANNAEMSHSSRDHGNNALNGTTAVDRELPEHILLERLLLRRQTCMVDFISDRVLNKVFSYLDFKNRVRSERVCLRWRRLLTQSYAKEKGSVWVYLIFRRNLSYGHETITVKISSDGPIFWSKMVVYIYCCSCHFSEKHEPILLAFFEKLRRSVQRLCAVDSPINLPFLTNSFYEFAVDKFDNLQFLYLRELDLENMNFTTVRKFIDKNSLKKVIVHDCINYDALTEYGKMEGKLLLFNGAIKGLKALLGDEFYEA